MDIVHETCQNMIDEKKKETIFNSLAIRKQTSRSPLIWPCVCIYDLSLIDKHCIQQNVPALSLSIEIRTTMTHAHRYIHMFSLTSKINKCSYHSPRERESKLWSVKQLYIVISSNRIAEKIERKKIGRTKGDLQTDNYYLSLYTSKRNRWSIQSV